MWAATYYVSSSSGNDANPGTQTQPFQTIAKVNGLSLAAGDSVLLKRGDTWNEQLIASSSGTAGSPISFDAYGTGAAPVLTPLIGLAGATWIHNSGNIYTTTLTTAIASPQINNVQFGSLWGRKRNANPGCTSAGVILGPRDFCVVYPTLYVYSQSGTSPSAYYGAITAVVGQPSGLAVISVVNANWLVFQHIKVQNFDYMGVAVTGNSDHLVFANMESDGMVPYGTTPHGFYVDVSSGYGTSIQFLNDDAFLNYDGFRVDGASSVMITNCRGYANRDAGLKDNAGTVTYSYSHFYGNNIAQLTPRDLAGSSAQLTSGAGNVASTIAPVVANFTLYPARISLTVDDVGSSSGTEAYIDGIVSTFGSRGLKFNAAVVPSYAVSWPDVNNWQAAGNEIDSHSWSHQYYTTNTSPCAASCTPPYPNAPAIVIQYTGSGTAATMTISNGSSGTFSTNVTGAMGDNLGPISLASYSALTLYEYLQSQPHYSVQQNSALWTTNSWPLSRPNTSAQDFLAVSNADIKTAPYTIVYDQTLLEPDEMLSSKNAIQTNVPGLTESFYVYPDGIEDPTVEADAIAAGYTAARGSLAMKDQTNQTQGANSLYSNGVNIQDITSLGAIGFHGLSQSAIYALAGNLVFRASAWGVPYGLFWHWNSAGNDTPDISNTELANVLDGITNAGGSVMTNMAMANAVTSTSGANVSGTTRWVQNPTGVAVHLAVASAGSPTVGTGTPTAYPIDLNGVNRTVLGTWDIGASAYVSQRYGTPGGSGQWKVQ